MRRSCTAVVALAALALAPGVALAQTNSTLTGEVTDNTGGILPGVTVEASSPALIEGSRVAITDGSGRYTLVDLRPGLYNLSFTLPGFSTEKLTVITDSGGLHFDLHYRETHGDH